MPSENPHSREIIYGRPPPLPTTRRGVTPKGSNDVLATLAPEYDLQKRIPKRFSFQARGKAITQTTRAPSDSSRSHTAFGITEPWAGASLQPNSSFDSRLYLGRPASRDYLHTSKATQIPHSCFLRCIVPLGCQFRVGLINHRRSQSYLRYDINAVELSKMIRPKGGPTTRVCGI